MRLGYGKRGSLELGCHLAPGLRRETRENTSCVTPKRGGTRVKARGRKKEKKGRSEWKKGGREGPV